MLIKIGIVSYIIHFGETREIEAYVVFTVYKHIMHVYSIESKSITIPELLT